MRDFSPAPDLVEAGARFGRASAPDPVTLGWLQEECARLERILRLQYDDGVLPGAWEREVAMLKPTEDTTRGLQLWSYLKHLYRVRGDGWAQIAGPDSAGSEEAARALLRREPITVQICGRRIDITGRSYAAMMEMAVHDLRVKEIDEVLERVTESATEVHEAVRSTPARQLRRRLRLRKRARALTGAYARLATERELHRSMIYAHALTKHGGPARGIEEAPEWIDETGPMEDAQLIQAMWAAGPGRVAALPRGKPGKDEDDGFGFASLFTFWERKAGLPPGTGWDTDLGQLMADVRAGNAPYDALGEEE